MRTTLNLDDELIKEAKIRAAKTGSTLTSVIERALRDSLRGADRPAEEFILQWETVRGRPRAGVDLTDRDVLYDVMEGRR